MDKEKSRDLSDMSETEMQHAERGHGGGFSGVKSRRTRRRQEKLWLRKTRGEESNETEEELHSMTEPEPLEEQTDGELEEVIKDPYEENNHKDIGGNPQKNKAWKEWLKQKDALTGGDSGKIIPGRSIRQRRDSKEQTLQGQATDARLQSLVGSKGTTEDVYTRERVHSELGNITDEDEMISIIHDAISDEDHAVKVVDVVLALTKIPDIDYSSYVESLFNFPNALIVKLADMNHNLGDNPSPKQQKKYGIAVNQIKEFFGGKPAFINGDHWKELLEKIK